MDFVAGLSLMLLNHLSAAQSGPILEDFTILNRVESATNPLAYPYVIVDSASDQFSSQNGIQLEGKKRIYRTSRPPIAWYSHHHQQLS